MSKMNKKKKLKIPKQRDLNILKAIKGEIKMNTSKTKKKVYSRKNIKVEYE